MAAITHGKPVLNAHRIVVIHLIRLRWQVVSAAQYTTNITGYQHHRYPVNSFVNRSSSDAYIILTYTTKKHRAPRKEFGVFGIKDQTISTLKLQGIVNNLHTQSH